jgi:hypothetical protein
MTKITRAEREKAILEHYCREYGEEGKNLYAMHKVMNLVGVLLIFSIGILCLFTLYFYFLLHSPTG